MSIGFTDKDMSTGKHYGFGSQTSIPRLAEYALIFTRNRQQGNRTVGLLSPAFSQDFGAHDTKLPLCTWEPDGAGAGMLLATNRVAPLTHEQRYASLHYILNGKGCPFGSEEELLREFETLGATAKRVSGSARASCSGGCWRAFIRRVKRTTSS